MTDRSAIGFECKKHHMRQTGEGWVISFVVHPDDIIPHWFSNARISTPMKVAVELVDPDADMQSASAPEKKRERVPFDELKPSQQAGILCADPEFWEFLAFYTGGVEASEDGAAQKVRDICNVGSRSALDADPEGNATWRGIIARFRDWQRTDNRYSGTPAYEASR